MLGAVRAYRDRTGRDLTDDTISAKRADGSRIVVVAGTDRLRPLCGVLAQ